MEKLNMLKRIFLVSCALYDHRVDVSEQNRSEEMLTSRMSHQIQHVLCCFLVVVYILFSR